jgi:hypothetical protein
MQRISLRRIHMLPFRSLVQICIIKNGKGIPVLAGTGRGGSKRLKLPDFKTIVIWMWWGCEPYAPTAFTARKYSWYSHLLEAESTPGP